jgi:hypothetical protein
MRNEEEEEEESSYCTTLTKREDTGIERGSTRSHSMENWLWKIL